MDSHVHSILSQLPTTDRKLDEIGIATANDLDLQTLIKIITLKKGFDNPPSYNFGITEMSWRKLKAWYLKVTKYSSQGHSGQRC